MCADSLTIFKTIELLLEHLTAGFYMIFKSGSVKSPHWPQKCKDFQKYQKFHESKQKVKEHSNNHQSKKGTKKSKKALITFYKPSKKISLS
jgi:hypothetical protein